jgi:hypothetical protein
MNTAAFHAALSPSTFAEANAKHLRLGVLTRQRVLATAPEGQLLRRGDGTPLIAWQNQVLGAPLPRAEIQKAISSLGDSTLFIVFGIGTGYIVKYLRKVTTNPIIVYEPNVGLLRLLLESGPVELDDVDIVTNPHDLALAWGRYSGRRRDAIILSTPGYSSAFPEQSAELPEVLRRLVERVTITKNTYSKRARTWVRDVLDNLYTLIADPPLLSLEGAYRGVPAFIVGAGPSLDKNIEELRRARAKGIVFVANSAAFALAQRDIIPHVICCLESIDISYRLRTLPYLDDVIRAFSLSAHPSTLKTGNGPLLPFHEALPQYSGPLESLTRVPGVTVCGSVSTAAFSLAQLLGCSPIVLVGQDMAFTGGGTYASGTGFESSKAHVDTTTGRVLLNWNDEIQKLHGTLHGRRHDAEPLIETTAWGGQGTVTSGPSFMAINAWLEATAAVNLQLTREQRYVNATEGGARVVGFVEESLSDVLDRLPDLNITVDSMVSAARDRLAPLSAQAIQQWCDEQAREAHEVARQARRVRRLSRHALHVLSGNDAASITRSFSAIDTAEEALKAAVTRVPLVDAWSHVDIDALVVRHGAADIHGDSRVAAKAAVELGLQVAAAIEKAAKELERHLRSLSLPLDSQEAASKGNSQCR